MDPFIMSLYPASQRERERENQYSVALTIRTVVFLPAAKPTGHRKGGVVVIVVVGLLGNDFEGRPKVKVKVNLCGLFSFPYLPP